MAYAEPFPVVYDDIRGQVGWHINAFLNANPAFAGWNDLALRETLPVWTLTLEPGAATIASQARDTERWHHQLYSGETVVGYVRTKPSGLDTTTPWQVTGVFASAVAAGIAESIRWVDANTTGNPRTRMLVVPSFRVTGLWLSGDTGDGVVVADRPSDFPSLVINRLYTESEFLSALRALSPIVGFRS
jgi:hypothetical protein